MVEHRAVAETLPGKRSANFERGGVLHSMIDGDTPAPAQPVGEVLHADAHVVAESGLGALSRWEGEQFGLALADAVTRLKEEATPPDA